MHSGVGSPNFRASDRMKSLPACTIPHHSASRGLCMSSVPIFPKTRAQADLQSSFASLWEDSCFWFAQGTFSGDFLGSGV